jgi:glycine hydroxymethyltransferase
MASKAVALKEASQPAFQEYAARIVENARALADGLQRRGARVATGGTDNHIVLADVASSFGLTGRQGESALRAVGMTLNRNSLPFDPNGPWYTSGLRLGTPALTTLGMGTDEVDEIADVAVQVLRATTPATVNGKPGKAKFETEGKVVQEARARIAALCEKFPVYPEIDLSLAES